MGFIVTFADVLFARVSSQNCKATREISRPVDAQTYFRRRKFTERCERSKRDTQNRITNAKYNFSVITRVRCMFYSNINFNGNAKRNCPRTCNDDESFYGSVKISIFFFYFGGTVGSREYVPTAILSWIEQRKLFSLVSNQRNDGHGFISRTMYKRQRG